MAVRRASIRQIEKIIGREFEYRKVPTPEHIIEKQLYNLADRLERVQVNEEEIDKYLPGVRKKLEWLSEEDLLKRVLSLEFNRLLAYYQNMPDIDLNEKDRKSRSEKSEKSRGDRREKDRRDAESGYERIMVNIGKAAGFFPGNLMELINRNVNGSKPEIGRIDLMPGYTLFDVRKEDAHRVLDALRHAEFFGDKIRAEVASPDRDYAAETADRPRRGKGGNRRARINSVRRKPARTSPQRPSRTKRKTRRNRNQNTTVTTRSSINDEKTLNISRSVCSDSGGAFAQFNASQLTGAATAPRGSVDSVFNAQSAFIRMPAQTLDLLTSSMRLDMIDYYRADSIAEIQNALEGLSHPIRPMSDSYLKVQVTPVTTLTVRMLPYGKGQIAASAYTIGDSLQAADTELRFYDKNMTELKRDKFIKLASTEDFFNFDGVDSKTRKEMLALVPFPTVEYSFEPDSNRLHAYLTVGEFLGQETVKKITPYLRRDRCYEWDGKKYKMVK